MRIVITAAPDSLGSRLARKLLERGAPHRRGGRRRAITSIVLLDEIPAAGFDDRRVTAMTGDLSVFRHGGPPLRRTPIRYFIWPPRQRAPREADFDTGMRESRRHARPARPLPDVCGAAQFVFTSSVAVFGGPFPTRCPTTRRAAPQAFVYGAQKVIGEYLVYDATRKGFIDGRSLRADGHCTAGQAEQGGVVVRERIIHRASPASIRTVR
jgi:nucleoside-diphosphate-sugar epimerase